MSLNVLSSNSGSPEAVRGQSILLSCRNASNSPYLNCSVSVYAVAAVHLADQVAADAFFVATDEVAQFGVDRYSGARHPRFSGGVLAADYGVLESLWERSNSRQHPLQQRA